MASSVGNEQLAVERQHKVGSVRDGGQGRVLGQLVADAFDTLTTEAEVVDEDVAHHIDFRQLCSLTIGNAIVADACGEKQVRETVDDEAVDLLRHIDIEGACACGNMGQQDTLLLGDDGSGHS